MIRIIPAILTHNALEYQSHLKAVEPHFSEAHVDFMDGVFVRNKSVTPKEIKNVKTPLKLEAHLMVQDPSTYIQELFASGFKKIIVHQEIGLGLQSSIRLIKGLGLTTGVAVNPESDLTFSEELWRDLDTIQIMGVEPGHYGGVFQPLSLEKIGVLRAKQFPRLIQVDGGVTLQTAPTLFRAGASSLVVGHYFFGSEEEPSLDKIGEKLESLRAALGTT